MFLTQPSLGFSDTLAVTQASKEIDCQQLSHVSFQVTQTAGSVSFNAQLQVSNNGVNWVDMGTPTAISAGGSIYIEKADVCARYVRLNLVRTSGTLTGLQVVFNGKF